MIVPGGLADFARDRAPARFIVMHDVLEHIEDDVAAAATLRGLVATDGTVVLSVPALMSLFGRHDEELGHYRRYTPRTLQRVLAPHFVVERLQWYGMASIPIAWYFSRWRRIAYPLGSVRSPLGAAYAAVCEAESYLREPIGTSLIARLRPQLARVTGVVTFLQAQQDIGGGGGGQTGRERADVGQSLRGERAGESDIANTSGLLRPSADGCVVYLYTLGIVEIFAFVLLYLVK